MSSESIPLGRLEADLRKYLERCLDSGEPVIVEPADHRRVAILGLDPDDDLVDRLIESNPDFRALVTASKAGPRAAFF